MKQGFDTCAEPILRIIKYPLRVHKYQNLHSRGGFFYAIKNQASVDVVEGGFYCIACLYSFQESNDRKENGKNVKVFSGNKKALLDFLNVKNSTGVFLLLEKESEIIIDELNKREPNQSFKLEYPSFSLYYNPLNKKKPFSMFITESLNMSIKLSKPIQFKFTIKKEIN